MGDTNCTAGSQRIYLHHTWAAMDGAMGNWSGKRAIKYLVCDQRGKKPGVFCKKSGVVVLSGKCGQERKREFNLVTQSREVLLIIC
jgi:hypothetical protein